MIDKNMNIQRIAYRIATSRIDHRSKMMINKTCWEQISRLSGKSIDDVAIATMEAQDYHSAIELLAEQVTMWGNNLKETA